MNCRPGLTRRLAASLALGLSLPTAALAHPHVFAEARLEITVTSDGTIGELLNVWRFDEVFSSSLLFDFDNDGDMTLDHEELEEIAQTIRASLADYGYFTFVTHNGASKTIAQPQSFHAQFQDGQLLLVFAVKPEETIPLKGNVIVGVYDPTFYTAIDFASDEHIALDETLTSLCGHSVIRPDPDEVLAQNQQMMTESFFNDPNGQDLGKLFATRLEMQC